MTLAPLPRQAWRAAALVLMNREELRTLLSDDAGETAAWVDAAAACGIAAAQVRLGQMLLSEEVGRDAQAAFACLFCAAQAGDAEAAHMLGHCYRNGWGTMRDMHAAAHCYAHAAEAGLAGAQHDYACLLRDGDGIARDRDAAFAWYMRAASGGDARAMNEVGLCFAEGLGVARDEKAARNWYRKSAEGGSFRGSYNYAALLAQQGCIAGAELWFRRALGAAPEPALGEMTQALMRHPHPAIRALASRARMREFCGGTLPKRFFLA